MAQPVTSPPIVAGRWVPLTWEQFLVWAPDEGQAEWVAGRGIAYVSNSTRHGALVEFLSDLIGAYLRLFGLGQLFTSSILMRLPTRPSGRMPDLVVVRTAHADRIGRQWLEGPADLVVELVSEDSVERDQHDKVGEYEAAGVPEYLVVDAREGRPGVAFYRRDAAGRYQRVAPDGGGRYHSVVLPGFWLDPTWLWQDPLPNVERLLMRIAPDAYWRYLTKLRDEESGA